MTQPYEAPDVSRRDALKLLLGTAALPLAGCAREEKAAPQPPAKAGQRMPSIFLAHGSPQLLDNTSWVRELSDWAGAMPRPKAVLMLSAHWEYKPVTIGATSTVPLVYDFYNFPKRYYEVKYPAPGAPELAARVRDLLSKSQPIHEEPERGLDHGAYVPLMAMYPEADVPVLQLSLPTMDPTVLFNLGRALTPLRREGVLIVGSGFLSHNLRSMDREGKPFTPCWAEQWDAWCAETLSAVNVDALLDYRARAPGVDQALPTHEHFVPVVVAMGAAVDDPGSVAFPITGFLGGSLTRRSVQFG